MLWNCQETFSTFGFAIAYNTTLSVKLRRGLDKIEILN